MKVQVSMIGQTIVHKSNILTALELIKLLADRGSKGEKSWLFGKYAGPEDKNALDQKRVS